MPFGRRDDRPRARGRRRPSPPAMSSIRASSVAVPPTRSDRPVPRLSKRISLGRTTRAATSRAPTASSQPSSTCWTNPGTRTRSNGPSPTTWYAMLTSPLSGRSGSPAPPRAKFRGWPRFRTDARLGGCSCSCGRTNGRWRSRSCCGPLADGAVRERLPHRAPGSSSRAVRGAMTAHALKLIVAAVVLVGVIAL